MPPLGPVQPIGPACPFGWWFVRSSNTEALRDVSVAKPTSLSGTVCSPLLVWTSRAPHLQMRTVAALIGTSFLSSPLTPAFSLFRGVFGYCFGHGPSLATRREVEVFVVADAIVVDDERFPPPLEHPTTRRATITTHAPTTRRFASITPSMTLGEPCRSLSFMLFVRDCRPLSTLRRCSMGSRFARSRAPPSALRCMARSLCPAGIARPAVEAFLLRGGIWVLVGSCQQKEHTRSTSRWW